MASQTYVKTEVVGSSDKSVSDAIESAIGTASRSLRNLDWFEVVDVRGRISRQQGGKLPGHAEAGPALRAEGVADIALAPAAANAHFWR
jgi:flavin-binding protein dodecin